MNPGFTSREQHCFYELATFCLFMSLWDGNHRGSNVNFINRCFFVAIDFSSIRPLCILIILLFLIIKFSIIVPLRKPLSVSLYLVKSDKQDDE